MKIESIRLDEVSARRFIELLLNPPPPSQKLIELMASGEEPLVLAKPRHLRVVR
jgi:uncharacterized protein (DUF1778 family)